MVDELADNIIAALGSCEVSASGYHQITCPVCGDYKKRAGFSFQADKIVYSCFRGKCDASSEYVYGDPLYPKFREILTALGVDIPIELRAKRPKKNITYEVLDEDLYEKHTYDTIELPSDTICYNNISHYWIADYLKSRCIDFKRKIYVNGGRLLVPFLHNNKLIGYQTAAITENKNTFYQTSSGNTDLMFINSDGGYVHRQPYIVEGVMDAIAIPNAIAILGNSVSRKQAYHLRNCAPILIPDRKGSNFIKVAKLYGWQVSIPNWKVKDVNEAIIRYGKFVTMQIIHDGIQSDIKKAEVKFRAWQTK